MGKTTGRFIIFAAALVLASCGGQGGKEKEMGPEEVIERFNRAITAGDFATAKELCDTLTMKEYIDSYAEAWDVLQKEDSSALAIASDLLSGVVLDIEKIEKADEGKAVYYTLEADGHTKTRKAIVKKTEGIWKVAEITDAI